MPKDQILYYLNPLGESSYRLLRIEEKWKNLLFGRENLGISENPTEWFVHSKKHARQTDSTSCGVFVLKFLEYMLAGEENLDIDITGRILDTRKSIGQVLLKNSDDLEQYCRYCYTKESEERGTLVCCRQCTGSKYFHVKCECSLHPAAKGNNGQNNSSMEYQLRKNPTKKRKRSSYIYSDLKGRYTCTSSQQSRNLPDTTSSPKQPLDHSLSWLYDSVHAYTEQCKRLVNALCRLSPGRDLMKGASTVSGHKISVLFENHIKAKLTEVTRLKDGRSSCYEPHWRHVRWIKRQPLNEHLEMRNSEKGIEERSKLFGKGWKELYALVLEEFGVFKPKTIIRIGYCHGHYLSMKEDKNEPLMATLEDEMGQNMNEGVRYFKDVLFVESEIFVASLVWNLTLLEAERRLYPIN